jgi:hypothetical protein
MVIVLFAGKSWMKARDQSSAFTTTGACLGAIAVAKKSALTYAAASGEL